MKPDDISECICYTAPSPAEKAALGERVQEFCKEAVSPEGFEVQKILDLTSEDTRLCLYWEKFPGVSLEDEYIRANKLLSLPDLRDCLPQIKKQLAFIHATGFALRDINPGTIVRIDPPDFMKRNNATLKPAYKLIVSSIFSKLSELTLDAKTCLFLAPEELSAIQRDPGTPDNQPGALGPNDVSSAPANVYKLALVFYTLLTGYTSPFDKIELLPSQIIRQRLQEKPTLRGLPKQLRPLFLRALSKHPGQRPTIDEFQFEFEEICKQIAVHHRRRRQPRSVPKPPAQTSVGQIESLVMGYSQLADFLRQEGSRRWAIKVIAGAAVLLLAIIADRLLAWLPGVPRQKRIVRASPSIGQILLSFQHQAPISALAPSPDGKLILSADQSGEWKIWDASKGKEIQSDNRRHEGVPITAVAWSKSNQVFATLSSDGMAWVWEFKNRQYRPLFHHPFATPTKAIAFSPTGDHLVVGTNDDVAVYDFVPNKPFGITDCSYEGHQDVINSVTIAKDGSFAASASNDNTAQTWIVEIAQQQVKYMGHGAEVATVSISPDGRYVASGGVDRSVQVWDAQSGSAQILYHHTDAVCCVTWDPDGQFVASGGDDRVIRIYDLNGNHVYTTPTPFQTGISTIAWLPGHRIVSSSGSTISIWVSP